MTPSFAPPVDQLLSLGTPGTISDLWTDYVALGVTDEHVPELIRMATEPALNEAYSESLEVWAPLHAWRALGQLRAASAAEPLTRLLTAQAEDDWVQDDLPQALGMIGGPAIGPARELLGNAEIDHPPRLSAMESISAVARHHPELRDEAVGALVAQLARWPDQEPGINAYLIGELAQLRAVEAAPVVEAAVRGGRVTAFWRGDWDMIRSRLGLSAECKAPDLIRSPVYAPVPAASPLASPSRPGSSAKSKNRRKEARAARKRNRRK
jgi:hypothetical protein